MSCGLRSCEPRWPLQFRWERCSYSAKRSGQNSVAGWLQRALSGLALLAGVIRAVSAWFPPALGNTGPFCLGREAGAVFRNGGHPGCCVCRLAGPSAEAPHLHPNTHRVPGSSKPNSKLGSSWLAPEPQCFSFLHSRVLVCQKCPVHARRKAYLYSKKCQ